MSESSIPAARVGSGDHVVICLPGWFGSSSGWGSFTEHLDGDRFSYVFPDYRGYGARRDQPGKHTMEEIASDTLTLADALDAQRFSLIGHSMGGKAIERVLVEAPERVRAMVGLSPVPASGFPFDDDGWALFAGAVTDDSKRAAIIDFTTGNRLTSRWVDRMVRHSAEQSTREAFGDYLEAWGHGDFSDRITGNPAAAAVPVKVIVGAHDPALAEGLMRQTWLLWHPDAELEVLPNAGHYANFETPVALATTIEEFLGRH
jgi:pimeloyl-ACP methyl ester carboxylesterase